MTMIKKINANELFVTEENWRVSRYHFSYADYHNASNLQYGVLRALNDETIQPSKGFDSHPHDEMEIISYCVQGELTHRDDMGNDVTIRGGDAQYMCAGSGIMHAEMNASMDQPLRFMQIWILPNEQGLIPHYDHKKFFKGDRINRWLQVASSEGLNGALQINQDASVFVSEITKGEQVEFSLQKNRMSYLTCIEGVLHLNDITLTKHESAEIAGEAQLIFKALEDTHLLMIEMAGK